MALKFEEVHSPEFAIFQQTPLDTGIQDVKWINFSPISQLSDNSAIDFQISPDTGSYIDLKRSLLNVKCKLVDSDGANLTDYISPFTLATCPQVGPINLFLHSLFQQVDVALQDQIITPSVGTHYPFKALFDCILFNQLTESELSDQMYIKDVPDMMDIPNPTGNNGAFERAKFFEQSKEVEMSGPIFMDVCQQDKFMINGVKVNIKLWPSQNSFRLMAADPLQGYKVKITSAVLQVCMVTPTPGILLGHSEALKLSPAVYNFKKSIFKTHTIAAGTQDVSISDLFQGQAIPEQIFITMISNSGYSGNYVKCPYNFSHFDLSHLAFCINNTPVPSDAFAFNFSESKYLAGYKSLVTRNTKSPPFITREDYSKNGYFGVLIDLTTSKDKEVIQLDKRGLTRLDLRFKSAIKEAVTVLIYGKKSAFFQIDEARNVIL